MNNTLPILVLENIVFSYGDSVIIKDVSLSIEAGETIALVGPSGCGKSTLLRIISGLEQPKHGLIRSPLPRTENVNLGFLFQDYDAYPWLTVLENVRTGSGPCPLPDPDQAREILTRVGLSEVLYLYPRELSGGMRKRLGLARCLVRRPRLLLLDEPFASLDVDTKFSTYDVLQEIAQRAGIATLIITHDLHEAIFLADIVLVASQKPMRIVERIDVKLERPRAQSALRSAEFHGLVAHLSEHFGGGSRKGEEKHLG